MQKELFYWGKWYIDTTGVDGFRFDAVKHVKAEFFVDWLEHLRNYAQRDFFAVGEYWSGVDSALEYFINTTEQNIMLFDTGLHYSFAAAGRAGQAYDLRTVFDNSLVKDHPDMAVTLVSNHDTQPLQSLESVVEAWFKPLAYALILLRQGGYPCIFAADYYGAEYKGFGPDGNEHEISMPSHKWLIDRFLDARRRFAFGEQYDYSDDPHRIGWTRLGNDGHSGGLAVLISNDQDSVKAMQAVPNTTYADHTNHVGGTILTDQDGWGEFRCNAQSVSVWIPAS